ncbi:MAG: D-aminoacyl-tRNA deacylase [Dehalococcoidia bacterium]
MRIVVQRVTRASVTVAGDAVSMIGSGLLLLVGIAAGDTEVQARQLAAKIVAVRIFEDDEGKMNRSIAGTGGEILAVSQFTLLADTRRGNRPSFTSAARPEEAIPVLDAFCHAIRASGVACFEGRFGAHMQVTLENDGPVTILLDSDTFDSPRRG